MPTLVIGGREQRAGQPQGGHFGVLQHGRPGTVHRVVALQVAFERQTLKPVFSLDRL